MDSLFNKEHAGKIIERINKLSNESQAQWGKMDVNQMLAHCQQPLRVASGELKLKRGLIGILFGSIAKKKLAGSEKPFDRNLPTDRSFVVTDKREFEKEKQNLIGLIGKFQQGGPGAITSEAHPFFGKMTAREWDILQWKHLDHHLRQFGA